MTNKFAATLNDIGFAHVANETARLGLNWDADATVSDITSTNEFMDLAPGDTMRYEISNIDAGKSGYGIFGTIRIDSDMVVWKDL